MGLLSRSPPRALRRGLSPLTRGRLEFFVEPFTEGQPGPHVVAAIKAVEGMGLHVEVGPFDNVVTGDPDVLVMAAASMLGQALTHGATRISMQIATQTAADGGLPSLHDALARMLRQVEKTLGAPLAELTRVEKQAAVRMLDKQGAFLLRRSIEEVADAMGVSRITIYNYLNAIREDG